jgi:hypothetical protein
MNSAVQSPTRAKPVAPAATKAPQGNAPPIVHAVLRSPGHHLDAADRHWLESRIGAGLGPAQAPARRPQLALASLSVGPTNDPAERQARQVADRTLGPPGAAPAFDFSRVQIHSDQRAGVSAQALHARAYTVGEHVVFAPGEYAPQTSRGRQLLAHELVHVAQQGSMATPTIQREPAPAGNQPAAASAPSKPAAEPARPEAKLTWKWKDLAVYPLLVDIWKDLIRKELTTKEREEMKLTGLEAAAFYNWAFAVGLAAAGLGGAKMEGEKFSKDAGTVSTYAEALQGVTPSSDAILDSLSRLLGLRFDKYLESDLFMARLKTHAASVATLVVVAQGIVSTVAAVEEPSEKTGELTEAQWSKQVALVRWLLNKILKERLKAPDFFDVPPLQLKTHPAFSATPFAGGAVPSGLTAESKTGVEESGKEVKLGLTLNMPGLLGVKDAGDPSKYRGWQTSLWFNYELQDPTETMKLTGKLPDSQLKGGAIFGGAGHLGLLEAGARYQGKVGEQLSSWFVRGGYGYSGAEGSTLKKIGFSATYVDWKQIDVLAPGRVTDTPTAGRAVQVTPFAGLHFGGKGMHQFDAGAALSFVSGSEEKFGMSGFRTDLSYTYLGARGNEKLPAFKLDLSGSLNRLDWHDPNSPLMWGVLAKGTVGRGFGGVQVMGGAGAIPEKREQLLGEPLKTRVPTAVIFSAGYAF